MADALGKSELCLEVVEQALSRSDYLLGPEFGAADIMMGFSLHLMSQVGVLDEHYPQALAYLQRLRSREAFGRAISA